MILRNLNTSVPPIDRAFASKLSREILELSDVMTQMYLNKLPDYTLPKTKGYTYLFSVHGAYSKNMPHT